MVNEGLGLKDRTLGLEVFEFCSDLSLDLFIIFALIRLDPS